MRKYAFTLAEVLITLGIIGVVAAMTLPTIIDKSQKLILKNQFKKAYSVLSQALLKSEADLGFKPKCNIVGKGVVSAVSGYQGVAETSDCAALKAAMLKNLAVIKECKNNAYANGCIPEYIGLEKVYGNNNPDLTEDEAMDMANAHMAWTTNDFKNNKPAYVLKDGMILIPYSEGLFMYVFYIDVNGKKGPNKHGYDLFPFVTVASDKSNLLLEGYASYPVEKGGTNVIQMLRAN